MPNLEDKTFLLLVIVVSAAFAWVLWPFYGAILWGTITAIVFVPLYRWLFKLMPHRRNLAAGSTVLIIIVMVILPLTLITMALLQEAVLAATKSSKTSQA